MHLRLLKFESFLDKQGKVSFMQADTSQKIKGEFGVRFVYLPVIFTLIKRHGRVVCSWDQLQSECILGSRELRTEFYCTSSLNSQDGEEK